MVIKMHEHRIRQIFPSNGWSYYRHVITQRDCYSMEATTNGLRGMSSSFVHSGLHRTRKKNRKIERRKKRGSREKANPPERNYDEYRSLFSSTMAVVMSPLLLRSCETALEMKRRTRLVVRNIVRG